MLPPEVERTAGLDEALGRSLAITPVEQQPSTARFAVLRSAVEGPGSYAFEFVAETCRGVPCGSSCKM